MKPITTDLRRKIQLYIKERQDISELIEGFSLRGENLSGAIIKKIQRLNDDISNVDLSYAILGETETSPPLIIAGCTARNCNFKGARVLSRMFFRGNDARGSIFVDAFLPYTEWQGTDVRSCKWCGVVVRVGAVPMKGMHADPQFFREIDSTFDIGVDSRYDLRKAIKVDDTQCQHLT